MDEWKTLAEKFRVRANENTAWYPKHRAISELCEYIADSRYGNELKGYGDYTHQLDISLRNPVLSSDNQSVYFRIESVEGDELELSAHPEIGSPKYYKSCLPDELQSRFSKIMDEIEWYLPRASKASRGFNFFRR